jgi:DUF1009 family protein
MDRYGFVTTPSALARELITAFAHCRPEPYYVFAIHGLTGVTLPPGSEVVSVPTYTGFWRFLRRNRISRVVFVASLNMGPIFWVQALCHWRFLSFLVRESLSSEGLGDLLREVPSQILKFIADDLEGEDVEVAHPHEAVPNDFKLLPPDCFCNISDGGRVQIRLFVDAIDLKRLGSFFTLSEACLVGIPGDGGPQLIAVEKKGTQDLMARVTPAHKRRFRRIVLVKKNLDQSLIAYPVIGTDTVRGAMDNGITDILVEEVCVIQGKTNLIRLAREARIGIDLF